MFAVSHVTLLPFNLIVRINPDIRQQVEKFMIQNFASICFSTCFEMEWGRKTKNA